MWLVRGLLGALMLVLFGGLLELRAQMTTQSVLRQAPIVVTGRLALPRGNQLWLVDARTGAERLLLSAPPSTTVTQASWSPDGQRIAYALYQAPHADRAATSGLHVLSVDQGEPSDILTATGVQLGFAEPTWTPDGRGLVYRAMDCAPESCGRETTGQIEHISLEDGVRSLLVADASGPALSRDGRQLAFVRRPLLSPRGRPSIWLADAAGNDPRPVLADERFVALAFARFAPGGDRLAFAAVGGPTPPPGAPSTIPRLTPGLGLAHGVPWDLWEINLDGGGLRRLTDLGEDYSSLAWSPDGRWLAFRSWGGLYLLEVATTAVHLLSDTGGFGGMDWTD